MKKIKFIALTSILLLVLIVAPMSFAVDNETDFSGDVLATDYYFDSGADNDTGNGTIDNPYKVLTSSRITDNSVIHLNNGTYNFSSSKTIRNVTIIGQNAQATIIKNAKFTVSSYFTLYNVTLLSSTVSNNGVFNASNTIFKDSSSSNGGVISSTGTVNLDNCSFTNNSAEFGGAVYIKDGILNISNSQFADNYASFFGGAITTITSNVTIGNTSFRNNSAKYYGGAVYLLYGKISLTDSLFMNNTAREGGALLIDDANPCYIYSNQFLNNSAAIAGAVYSISNNLTSNLITDNIFLENTSDVVIETVTPNLTIGNGNYTFINNNITYIDELPSSYDLRDYGYVTDVRNQGSGGNCWAFASLAALESCILKATGISCNLSEENMKNLMAKFSDYGWKMDPNKGGYDDMAVGYLVSWLGPVNESDDSYSGSSFLSPVLSSFYHIQNVLYLTRSNYTDNDAIKKAIMMYGAVSTSIYWDGNYRNGANYYYNETNGANHAVTIVGWNDNYSKSNFKNTPSGDGAWIIKNSWGTGSGDKGYYYVSYYDTRCAQPGRSDITYTFIFNDSIKYDKNYQYDIPGKTDFFVNNTTVVWYKNKFISTDNEYLTAVSTYFEKITNYTFYIYVNNILKHTQSGISDIGYFTFDLNNFVQLNKGDIFEVVFKITVDGDAGSPISEVISLNKLLYCENISFLSYDGETWTDLYNLTWAYSSHTYKSQVACIKAFTVLNKINTTTELTLNITDGVANITINVFNQYNKPITDRNVTLIIDGETYSLLIINGIATFSTSNIYSTSVISAIFDSEGFIPSFDNISYSNTTVSLNISGIYNPVNITANVLDQFGKPVNYGNVTFYFDGVNVTVDVVNGSASVSNVFTVFGEHSVSAVYNGIYLFNSSSDQKSFDVYLRDTNIDLVIGNEFNPVNISVNVTDSYGDLVDYGYVTFCVDGVNVTADVVNGSANLIYSFKNLGLKNITVKYDGLYYYSSSSNFSSINVKTTIISNDSTKTYNSQYTVYLTDSYGNPLKNQNVSFIINNINYTVLTDSNGKAVLNINMNSGKYLVKIYNYETGEIKSQTINVVKRITENKALTMYYGAGSAYKVRVYDDNGNIAKNVRVKFTINNKNYYAYTNSNGYASLKISLKPGKYTITAEYKGFKVSNKVTIKSTVITKNKVFKKGKTIKFTAKLLNKNGKILKNKKITFKFKGKTYKVKTNKKGIATLKITKKYKVGKYTITSSYGSLKIKNTIRIKK